MDTHSHRHIRRGYILCVVSSFHIPFYLRWWFSCYFNASLKRCLFFGAFVRYTSGVSESARPNKHVDNVGGFITDGSCMCCQPCVSQLYQNKKLAPQLRLAVTAWWGIKTTERVVRLKLTLLRYCLHDMKYMTPAFASPIKHRADHSSWYEEIIKEDNTLCGKLINNYVAPY